MDTCLKQSSADVILLEFIYRHAPINQSNMSRSFGDAETELSNLKFHGLINGTLESDHTVSYSINEAGKIELDKHKALKNQKPKVIQLLEANKLLLALCDDGSIWSMSYEESDNWLKLPEIPNGS